MSTDPVLLALGAVAEFDDLVQRLGVINARRKQMIETIAVNEKAFEDATAGREDWARAADVIRSFSDDQSESLKADIQRLVSHGLSSVFGEPMEFKLTTRVLRGASSVEFSLVTRGVERPVLGSHGGGVSQVVGFVLRLVVTLLSTNRPFLILDEPFSQVSVEYRPRLAAFIKEITDSTPLQLVIVTHDTDLPEVADVSYRFSVREGASRIEHVDA